MQSGISTLQRGLIDTLLGIGLVSAGAGALNQALERSTDARGWFGPPIGRCPRDASPWHREFWLELLHSHSDPCWLLLHTNLLTVSLALLTAVHLRGLSTRR